ncbi:DUF4097 family beta strand repeat-containing protein [Streptomyces sp. CC224B]|uniref:DUF4097 family beta strand repeat-containing protein n=1 Tax=Streptomyces sp. CC224B TaxID=3044571 RepID=UPI0024A994B9|nr:DUF4097 family beta strand repeat-containing protein [Streptomyces sp. CC224B]
MHETLTQPGTAPRPPGRPRRSVPRRVARALALLTALTLVGGGAWYLLLFLITRTETGTTAIDGDVRTVVVEIDSGDLRIDAAGRGDRLEVRKKLTKSLRSPDESVERDGDTLRVTADCGEGVGTCASDYRLTVPAGVRVRAVTRLGDVTVTGVRGSVEARSRIGDVRLRLPRDAGPYDVTAFTKIGERTVAVDEDDADDAVDTDNTAQLRAEARTKIGDVTVRQD